MIRYSSTWRTATKCSIYFQKVNMSSLLDVNFNGFWESSPQKNFELTTTLCIFFIELYYCPLYIHSSETANWRERARKKYKGRKKGKREKTHEKDKSKLDLCHLEERDWLRESILSWIVLSFSVCQTIRAGARRLKTNTCHISSEWSIVINVYHYYYYQDRKLTGQLYQLLFWFTLTPIKHECSWDSNKLCNGL